jgi:hypothetical protein
MKIYLTAVVLTAAATLVIVNACLLQSSAKRVTPINIISLFH